jgi:hypothetical protein
MIFLGSTTLPDEAAHYLTDPQGRRFQVVTSETASGSTVTLDVKGLDVGAQTNIPAGTVLRWARGPLGAQNMTAVSRFRGGTETETSQAFASRVVDAIRYKQGSGNRAHVRAYCRGIDSGIGDAYVYSCAYGGNSFHVALTAKRAGASGPLVCVVPAATVAVIASAITPPNSTEIPGGVFVVCTTVTPEPVTSIFEADLSPDAWKDSDPFPFAGTIGYISPGLDVYSITTSGDETSFAAAPSLMIWDTDRSRWEELSVASVVRTGANAYDVTVFEAPVAVAALGGVISPTTRYHEAIAQAAEAYFDALGPGQLVAATDPRRARATRFPPVNEQAADSWSLSNLSVWLLDALGPAVGPRGVMSVETSATTASVPASPYSGPKRLTLWQLGIQPMEAT